ncbi:VOC family protein [Azospirillum sp. YIM B02556]|uniref:2-oxoadipate dioxygenase/decarboxylase n=1 Tax=Azospirillum endophyticum TaxID=2800326 RepID=A0ABS1F0E5_9PROT|nr:VOC family protein [Azospirillum endophyticum]MBK1836894.1 VOC family protein [Azospirillum endophyticum]
MSVLTILSADATSPDVISPDAIRTLFSTAMSEMYRTEVPAYQTLMELVSEVNEAVLAADPAERRRLESAGGLDRITEERHGAIRLGTANELSTMRRLFAVMGMQPVGYYDLSEAGVPVHSTAFRPVTDEALGRNPFRVFTSLLRLDLIADAALRREAEQVLAARSIFTPGCLALIGKAEAEGGLDEGDAGHFVAEALETFRWHSRANVPLDLYHRLHDAHRLIADVVSFKGPHINHLTPRTLDIDAVQRLMPEKGISPKAVVEGPPTRRCPILLRQTSFKALSEPVDFRDGDVDGAGGGWRSGVHTARFGEIEQRGIALTPKGRALYDTLLQDSRRLVAPAADGSNAAQYMAALQEVFAPFPDSWDDIRRQGLGYFAYSLTEAGRGTPPAPGTDLETLVESGLVRFDPVVYEDFLPVSAAGIFQSNLGDDSQQDFTASPNQQRFEADLGAPVLNPFDLYAEVERASIAGCGAAR